MKSRKESALCGLEENLRLALLPYVERGDYRRALAIAKRAFSANPANFYCRYQYAKILGDWADELPNARKAKLKREAISILRPLLKMLSRKPLAQRFGICLNYYYQSEAFREMYAYGRRLSREDERLGAYAKGLAAAYVAQELQGPHRNAAVSWAEKSVEAWKSYGLSKEKYYFAHYVYAKALAIAGHKKLALASLKRAAKLGKRPLTDWEFADAKALIDT